MAKMNQILEYINNHQKETKRIIGITHEQLIKLIENAKRIEGKKQEAIAKTEKRLTKVAGRRKRKLSQEEEIVLTLYYLRHRPTFQLLGINFGISESNANHIFHYWIDIFRERELLPANLLEQVEKKENEKENESVVAWDFSPHILIQGINQPEAIAYLQQSELHKKDIVAGVADEYIGTTIEDIPVFDLVSSVIVIEKIPIITSLVFSHPHHVLDACYEAIDAGIKQIVIYTERICPLDLIKLYQKAESKRVQILGPSGGGILKPAKYDCGVKNADIFLKGNVGIINFAHETMAQEIALYLQEVNLGISTLINLGSDYFTKVNWDVWLNLLMMDNNTESIVIIISQITPLDAKSLILTLNQIKDKLVVIYLLDSQNWRDKIDHNQTKVILDQIYNHLYPISAIEFIKERKPQKNIIVTNNHYDIVKMLLKE